MFIEHTKPTSVKQALLKLEWVHAMKSEYDVLIANHTWNLTKLPPHRQAAGCKWVFKVKEDFDESVNKYKVRLVAKYFHQQQGFDFNETFSPVVKPTTIRVIISLALTYKWDI